MTRSLLFVMCLLLVVPAAGDDDLNVLPNEIDGVAPQEMMHAYLLGRALEALDRRDAEYEKIKTPEDVAAYQKRMRDFFVAQLGGFPERTPLAPQVVVVSTVQVHDVSQEPEPSQWSMQSAGYWL